MPRTLLPEIETPEARLALAEAAFGVLGGWGVAPAQQAALLKLAAPLAPGAPLPADPVVLECAGHLLGIERALKRRHPDDPAARHAWLMLPAPELDGRSPLRVMLDGVAGFARVRAQLEG